MGGGKARVFGSHEAISCGLLPSTKSFAGPEELSDSPGAAAARELIKVVHVSSYQIKISKRGRVHGRRTGVPFASRILPA